MIDGVMVQPGSIFAVGAAVEQSILDVFRRVGVANVASALAGPLSTQRLIDADSMRRRSGSGVVAGRAVTVWHPPGSNGMLVHALRMCSPGDVLVVDGPKDAAQWGDIAASLAQSHGVVGAVVDGAVRDLERMRELDFPLWSSRVHAAQGYRKDMGMVNVPVIVCGLLVRPGDVVVADSDGIFSVPRQLVSLACERALRREESESTAADGASSGHSPAEGKRSFEVDQALIARLTGEPRWIGQTWSEYTRASHEDIH